jgi:hypothetical protein
MFSLCIGDIHSGYFRLIARAYSYQRRDERIDLGSTLGLLFSLNMLVSILCFGSLCGISLR